jgi:SCP-2 sterol transfer family
MTDPSEAFFDKLRVVGRVPALARVSGTLRLELADGRRTEKTQITVHRGHVTVGPPAGRADCMVAAHRRVWDALVTGEAQPLTAFLRGALAAAGDPGMLITMRRLLAAAGVPELASGRPRLISPHDTAEHTTRASAPRNGSQARPAASETAKTNRPAASAKSNRPAASAKANRPAASATASRPAATGKTSRPAATGAAKASRPATATRTATAGRPAKARSGATRSAAGSRDGAQVPAGTASRAASRAAVTGATKARSTTAKATTSAATSRKGRA